MRQRRIISAELAAMLALACSILPAAQEIPSQPFTLPGVSQEAQANDTSSSAGAEAEENQTEGAGEEAQPEGTGEGWEVTINTLSNIRRAPDGTSEIIGVAGKGTVFTVYAVEGDWLKIEYNGQTAYTYYTNVDGLPDPEVIAAAGMKVTIFSSKETGTKIGDTIRLTSLLEGFENCEEIRYQWMCDTGNGFREVTDGGDSDTYSFTATKETLNSSWKLVVSYR